MVENKENWTKECSECGTNTEEAEWKLQKEMFHCHTCNSKICGLCFVKKEGCCISCANEMYNKKEESDF